MLTSQRLKMGLTNLAFERYNNLPKCMSYRFENGYSLVGKYTERLKSMYSLDSEQIMALDSLKECKEEHQDNFKKMRSAGIKFIYMKVTNDKFQTPMCLGESMTDLSLKCKCDLSNISRCISKFLSGGKSRYVVTLEPVCEDDEIEEQRLKAFFRGDVIECAKLTRLGQTLAKKERGV